MTASFSITTDAPAMAPMNACVTWDAIHTTSSKSIVFSSCSNVQVVWKIVAENKYASMVPVDASCHIKLP